ncbi:hypothetical protein [Vibrio alginolyticus]|uniref:hypothetical protein n=1 Tax=Vibrio alginolyticus TaxID=663 RepID=UPI00168CEA98|nr:hypothetical protein [Vibrio alginolyticus]MCR9506738.1 hypothetical protein [Vibrio alginolyticus]
MTLIIAGHTLERGFREESSNFERGLFVSSDSNITQNNVVLVHGFRKVYEVPVRVKALNFCGEWFNGYSGVRNEYKAFVAFAGSSLVAQHIMNSIENHLGELYPTIVNGEYQLAMSCETRKHLNQGYYSQDMFLDSDLENLVSAQYLAEVVKHSIEAVIASANGRGQMARLFSAYQAEFIFGVECPESREHCLYQYEIIEEVDGMYSNAIVAVDNIPKGSVAVIGMKELFKSGAQSAFDSAVENGEKTSLVLHDYLNESIRSNSEINNDIGFPSGLFNLNGNSFERVILTKE